MSNYNGRHGPNVSHYLRDLNTISPQESSVDENFNMESDLTLFTNTEFFDFETGQNTDFQAQPVKEVAHTTPSSDDVSAAPSVMGDMPNLDFISNEFAFNEFNNTYAPQMNTFADANHNFQPLQPNHGAQMPHQNPQYHGAPARTAEVKHKAEPIAPQTQAINFEEASRVAAEEDKRRRNTAASARFRIKKKQREQALEKSAKEMQSKVTDLENKVSQLETENKWLKNLLVEKNEGNEDISALWKEFTKQAGSKLNKSTGSSTATSAKEER
ncbi:Regulatory protein cys-3 [Cordyceps fumosorosea ARSEF 2679]|uniref:Regulatory protein cys-3 n=1 Tax=Cordyceps fumosorosea (strain ARSEF 2679) TaxID=1081104 RepID=A0A168B728_CORFA|nr:Regulatory protein cys-3 [Cordyceps fumosorosea ARSEF 2679]OAA69713.1 Regulatory protein cys-3 [Cordyceps fumosorosea ARSEF 2679]